MKYLLPAIAILAAVVAIVAYAPKIVDIPAQTSTKSEVGLHLSHQQQVWLYALECCESRGDPKAVNPKDRDGTPSYGLLQFKPSSFAYFVKLYGLASTSDYMDPDMQERIVTQMILKGGIEWSHQFPACVKKLGLPPRS